MRGKQIPHETLKEGFERAARDPDMLELAEWGMGDYQRMLSKDLRIEDVFLKPT